MRYLQEHGAGLLVIACNTATALAFNEIKAAVTMDVIGVVEPGASAPGEVASSNKKVVVIGTRHNHQQPCILRRALEARGVEVREKACPAFCAVSGRGMGGASRDRTVAQIYLSEAFSRNVHETGVGDADVLLLGCTHYPLIKSLLRRVAPDHIAIVDSAESTAQEVLRQLGTLRLPRGQTWRIGTNLNRPLSLNSLPQTQPKNSPGWERGSWAFRWKTLPMLI